MAKVDTSYTYIALLNLKMRTHHVSMRALPLIKSLNQTCHNLGQAIS